GSGGLRGRDQVDDVAPSVEHGWLGTLLAGAADAARERPLSVEVRGRHGRLVPVPGFEGGHRDLSQFRPGSGGIAASTANGPPLRRSTSLQSASGSFVKTS